MIVIGIDPGLSGAIAFLDSKTFGLSVSDMPAVDGRVDAVGLTNVIEALVQPGAGIAFIEAVASRPGQGVSSMFKFGQAFGTALGVIGAMKIPMRLSTPAKWKQFHRLGSEKEKARFLAISMWPTLEPQFRRKKDNGRAEAALIAAYGLHLLKAHGEI